MKARFEGDEGGRRLREALKDQKVLGAHEGVIDMVASNLELTEVRAGDVVIEENSPGGDVFFVIMGDGVEITWNNRAVAARETGQVLGEMSAIEPAGRRSATAKAVGRTLIGRLDGDVLQRIANEHPEVIYRGIARVVADRLRERSKFLRPRAAKPKVFVGSSVEGLPVAEAVRLAFNHVHAELIVWSDPGSVFRPSSTPIEDLAGALERFDFAIFVMTPDDLLKLRRSSGTEAEQEAVRDNVLLEFGLFVGALGRERVFGVVPQGIKMRLPTDLAGVSFGEYTAVAPGERPNLEAACIPIKDRIKELKAR